MSNAAEKFKFSRDARGDYRNAEGYRIHRDRRIWVAFDPEGFALNSPGVSTLREAVEDCEAWEEDGRIVEVVR